MRRAREEDLLDTGVPPDPGTARRRAFFGVPDLIQRLGEPWGGGDDELEVRRQETLAACSAFVDESAPLRVLFKVIGGRRAIAEMRVLAPNPGIRLIGGFLEQSVFVAVAMHFREEIAWKRAKTQPPSGTLEWRDVQDAADAKWKDVFGTIRPIVPEQLKKRRG